MRFRGRITDERETQTCSVLAGTACHWHVASAPPNMFQNSSFRVSDLSAGDFDLGTTFIHICTGKKPIVGADSIARKVFHKRARRHRKNMAVVKTTERAVGGGGANAAL